MKPSDFCKQELGMHEVKREGFLKMLLGCRFAYGSRQGIQATFEDPQGRVVPGRPHPVKVCSHRNTHNASQDYRLPLDCPFLGAFLAVHNTAITPISGSAGKNSQPAEHKPNFGRQNRRSRKGITGVWLAELGLSTHFRILKTEVCGKFRKPRPHRPFRAKKPQAEALVCSSVVNKSGFCRILPNSESLRSQY